MKSARILKKPLTSLPTIEASKSRMKLVCSDKIHIIPKAEIVYLKSDSNYCEVVMKDGCKIFCSQTLKSLYAKLPHSEFFRCHQSYVFNVRFLESVQSRMDELVLEGGIAIPISRSNRAIFRSKLEIWFD
ncbi:LytR/AlgR family response regulator transcription factor [Portibacter marinus]|uniref:LytR/AlgR family response regulator transcription factor n=1 Tax=Portibacter marinus TaxID=2898660 RepID=UPI001F37E127|nr:LytTR family DNA-binding domain-containing protein [Portibacter marinus]